LIHCEIVWSRSGNGFVSTRNVYRRPERATPHEAEVVAELRRAEVRRIGNRGRVPRPAGETEAAIVVVVGSHP